jgi:hypothetical protein
MLGVQDINQNKMLHLLSNHFMNRYVLLSMTWLTRWKSHLDYAKKFLDKSNMHLTVEKCVWWLKSTSRIMSLCVTIDSTKRPVIYLLAVTWKWIMGLWVWPRNDVAMSQCNSPLSLTPKKATQICAKNTPSLTFTEICTMNLTCKDKLWTKISIQLLCSIYRKMHRKISHEVVKWWVDFSLQQCSCSLCFGLEKSCG